MGGLPAEHGLRLGSVRDEAWRIAQPRRFDAHGNRLAGDLARGLDHFEDGVASSGAEIQEYGLAAFAKVLERAAIARTEEVAAGLERVRAGFGRAG